MPTIATFIQHNIGCQIILGKKKIIKGIQIEKEEAKLSLYVDDIIAYIENPHVSTKNIIRTSKWIQ